jgi:hypothetical protein
MGFSCWQPVDIDEGKIDVKPHSMVARGHPDVGIEAPSNQLGSDPSPLPVVTDPKIMTHVKPIRIEVRMPIRAVHEIIKEETIIQRRLQIHRDIGIVNSVG